MVRDLRTKGTEVVVTGNSFILGKKMVHGKGTQSLTVFHPNMICSKQLQLNEERERDRRADERGRSTAI